ncbi:MAG TPA: tRNA (N6-threonylcarbamoyladenosine(37)-N6)-methyltransferase TrmO [Anaerolineales bacterium]|nr:tRNA (N6-threonylcarbamoyladenosine(37)-N6)-methyltransferase TrmO [Anaerolineales bacterium]
MDSSYTMRPIGKIHSPFVDKDQMPIQASRSTAYGWVDVFPEFKSGLQDLDGFSHIFLLYVFHCSSGYHLTVQPFLDHSQRGLFSTRYPCRPNPIGLSIVRLIAVRDTRIDIEGVDVLDGTPLLDIKPYVPDFDQPQNIRAGWYSNRPLP